LVALTACGVYPSGGLLVLALSNGYMGLALFDAAPAPLPRYPSAQAMLEGHVPMIGATNGLMPLEENNSFIGRGGRGEGLT
jgi:hypothetical protein